MKRRKREPGPPPFIDQFGRAVYDNPFGRYRRNPALDATETPTAVARAWPDPALPNPRILGWEERERHFTAAQPVEPALRPDVPQPNVHLPAEPPPPAEERSVPSPSPERIAELTRLLEAAAAAAIPPVSSVPVSSVPEPAPPAPIPLESQPKGAVLSVADAPPAPRTGISDDVPATRAERLAKQLSERRARSRLRVQRGASIAAAGAAVFGLTAIYGFWTGGADAGSRVKKVSVLPVRAEATAGIESSPLTPGSRGNVKLRVDNPNAFAVTLTGISGGPFPSAVNGAPGCTIANSGVSFLPPRFLNVSIPARSSMSVRLVDAAQMGRGAAPECRGHTFTIPVAVTVATHKG